MTTPLVHLMVRYTSGHRAKLSRGWQRYGDRRPIPQNIAMIIAATLRLHGADVQLQPHPSG